jgi:hypothetical protein
MTNTDDEMGLYVAERLGLRIRVLKAEYLPPPPVSNLPHLTMSLNHLRQVYAALQRTPAKKKPDHYTMTAAEFGRYINGLMANNHVLRVEYGGGPVKVTINGVLSYVTIHG